MNDPANTKPRPSWCWFGLLLVCAWCAQFALLQRYRHFIIDDTFISLRYSRNLIDGLGLVFNAGERIEGYSNFLWVLFCAAAQGIGIDLVFAAQKGGWLFALATFIVVWFYATDSGRGWPQVVGAAAAGAFLLVSPAWHLWSGSGLESASFAFLVVLSALFTIHEKRGRVYRIGSGLGWTCVALSRPEGFGLFLITVAYKGVVMVRNGRDVIALVRWSAVFIAGFGLFLLWRLYYYGEPLPNTFYAKTGGHLEQWLQGMRYLGCYLVKESGQIIGLALGCGSLLLLVARRSFNDDWRKQLYLFSLIAGYGAFIVYVGGDWMPGYRFAAHMAPLIALFFAEGVRITVFTDTIRKHTPPVRLPVLDRIPVMLLAIAALFMLQIVLSSGFWKKTATYAAHIGASTSDSRSIAQWMRNHEPQAAIAVTDAGALPFYTGYYTIDMVGLLDKHISRLPGGLHEKFDLDYVLDKRPLFVETHLRRDFKLVPAAALPSAEQIDIPGIPVDHLYHLGDSMRIHDLAAAACWRGDRELYLSERFAGEYRLVVACKAPNNNYMCVFQWKRGTAGNE